MIGGKIMAYFTDIQQTLNLRSNISFEEKEKLNKYLDILEDSGSGEIIERATSKDYKKGGNPGYDPYKMYATILYAFSKHSGSVRRIEESMNYDLRFLYLMEEKKPSYSTISRFCNNVVVAHQKELYSCLMKTIVKKFEIDVSDTFIDGTKFEANANKYKFVWKPTHFHSRLNEGIKTILSHYFNIPNSKTSFISSEVAEYISLLEQLIVDKGLQIVSGKGSRPHQMVKDYNTLSKMLVRTLNYEEQESICGPGRNSYFKTDHDATAMCLKQDYYSGLGTTMHAAYSVQLLVSKGLILDYFVSQERADYKTFIPFLDEYNNLYGHYPKRVCADSGYGSLDNYSFMESVGIENYVKHQYWQKFISGEYADLFHFDEDKNLLCLNGKKATILTNKTTHSRGKGSLFYHVDDCTSCHYKPYCMRTLKDKNQTERTFETSYDLIRYRNEANDHLLSPKGIELRVNRSAQVEGAFGVIKQDMDYDRVRRRGIENVGAEIMLVSLGYNIRKLFTIFEGKERLNYWVAPDTLAPEIPRKFDIEKFLKKQKNNHV